MKMVLLKTTTLAFFFGQLVTLFFTTPVGVEGGAPMDMFSIKRNMGVNNSDSVTTVLHVKDVMSCLHLCMKVR